MRKYPLYVANPVSEHLDDVKKLIDNGTLTLVKEVPSVTTISGARGVGFGMVHSAWKIGKDGKDYRDEWGSAATKGTDVHQIAEDLAAFGPEGFDPSKFGELEGYAQALAEWWQMFKPNPIEIEGCLYSFEQDAAGRFDLYGTINRKLYIVDYKTVGDSEKFTKYPKCYVNNRIEIVARRQAFLEQGRKVDALALVRLAPDGTHHHYEVPPEDWDELYACFMRARREFDFIQKHDPPWGSK